MLPPSGITPAAACSLSRDWNHLKYSSTLAARHQPLACARHQRRARPSGPAGSGRLAGSVVAFISWTPHWTIPAPVVRNRWSTMRRRSGWKTSSASAIPTHSYGISRSCSIRTARFRPIGLLCTSVSSGYGHTSTRSGACRAAAWAIRAVAMSSSWSTIGTTQYRGWSKLDSRRSVGPATASSSRIGTRIAPGSSGEPGVPYRCGSLCSGRHHL